MLPGTVGLRKDPKTGQAGGATPTPTVVVHADLTFLAGAGDGVAPNSMFWGRSPRK
jgi:hypothetical protein